MSEEETNPSDHDILIEVRTELEIMVKQFDNHITHHILSSIMGWGTAFAAITSLVILLIKQ